MPFYRATSTSIVALLLLLVVVCRAFVPPTTTIATTTTTTTRHDGPFRWQQQQQKQDSSTCSRIILQAGYVPPSPEDDASLATKKKPSLHPKIGDFVRYYDLDGGKSDGEVLMGKISFIQKDLSQENSWLVDINELEDVGDGYYVEYPQRKKSSKRATRRLEDVSPVFASFVRSENAFKVPMNAASGEIQVRAATYDIDDYEGPFAGDNEINQEVVANDLEIYAALKGTLIKYSIIAGLAGTIIADLVKGTEDAIIYGAGAAASIGYLFFLSLKTDTLGSAESKFGSNVSNLRFIMPVLVIVGVAIYNQSLGDANPIANDNPFDMVTPEQFASAILGFLTYRLPLFFSQIQSALQDGDEEVILPGSAGVAMQLAAGASSQQDGDGGITGSSDNLQTVLVVSGPQATGRSELVQQLIAQGDGKFVEPQLLDSIQDGAKFERIYQRDEFLFVDSTGRFGLTKEGIFNAEEEEKVVVMDADIDLVKKVTKIPGLRLVGVWVGLAGVEDFEMRLKAMMDKGELEIPPEETAESVIRTKIREIVKEIEYGISSGVFEFTILNNQGEEDQSLRELQTAAEYCFR